MYLCLRICKQTLNPTSEGLTLNKKLAAEMNKRNNLKKMVTVFFFSYKLTQSCVIEEPFSGRN